MKVHLFKLIFIAYSILNAGLWVGFSNDVTFEFEKNYIGENVEADSLDSSDSDQLVSLPYVLLPVYAPSNKSLVSYHSTESVFCSYTQIRAPPIIV